MDRIHPWLVAAPLPAGDVAPALTSPRGTAALGPRGASSIPSPAEGKVKVYQGFCRGLTGPSAFYRLFKQLTSINQNGAGSVRSGEGRKSLLGSRGKESPVGMGCCGGLGTARALRAHQGTEDEGFASTNHLPHLTSITPAPSKVPGGNYNSSTYPQHSTGPSRGIALRLSRAKSRLWLGSGGPGHHPAPAPRQPQPCSG